MSGQPPSAVRQAEHGAQLDLPATDAYTLAANSHPRATLKIIELGHRR